jgi:hypothetical protein
MEPFSLLIGPSKTIYLGCLTGSNALVKIRAVVNSYHDRGAGLIASLISDRRVITSLVVLRTWSQIFVPGA